MRNFNFTFTGVKQFPARLLKLTRLDGTVLRIAEAETSITVGAETFTPLLGCEIMGVKHFLGGEVPSLQVNFAHSEGGTIDTSDLNVGKWDGAAAVLYIVDRSNITTLGDALFTGTVQPITLDPIGSAASFDCRGAAAQAEAFIQTYQPMCRTDLFSSLCQLDETAFDYTGTVGTIVDRFNFIAAGIASPPVDGWFNGGICVTASGFKFEIANYAQGTQKFTSYLPVCASRLTAGEAITVYPGCDKTIATCRTKFNNVINFQGEPHFLGINSIVGV